MLIMQTPLLKQQRLRMRNIFWPYFLCFDKDNKGRGVWGEQALIFPWKRFQK